MLLYHLYAQTPEETGANYPQRPRHWSPPTCSANIGTSFPLCLFIKDKNSIYQLITWSSNHPNLFFKCNIPVWQLSNNLIGILWTYKGTRMHERTRTHAHTYTHMVIHMNKIQIKIILTETKIWFIVYHCLSLLTVKLVTVDLADKTFLPNSQSGLLVRSRIPKNSSTLSRESIACSGCGCTATKP